MHIHDNRFGHCFNYGASVDKAERLSKELVNRFPDWTLDEIWTGLWSVLLYGFIRFVKEESDEGDEGAEEERRPTDPITWGDLDEIRQILESSGLENSK